MKKVIIVLIVLVLGIGGFWLLRDGEDEEAITDSSNQATNSFQEQKQEVVDPEVVLETAGDLADVTNGVTLRGINTGGASSGSAVAKYFDDSSYMLEVQFADLPDPAGDDFYEGWLVNPDTGEFFTTGKVDKNPDLVYVNSFEGTEDYHTQGYIRYVLTLEPNDGDPAPADHIVEGNLEVQ